MRDAILAAAGLAAEPAVVDTLPAPAEAAVAREADARASGHSEGLKAGAASERTRIKAIIGSDQAKGREELAHYFAFDTDMAADVVLAALARSPSGKSSLEAAMAREVQPRLGPGGERPAGDAPQRMISTDDVYARRRAAVVSASRR
jgi:capsid assembly protease